MGKLDKPKFKNAEWNLQNLKSEYLFEIEKEVPQVLNSLNTLPLIYFRRCITHFKAENMTKMMWKFVKGKSSEANMNELLKNLVARNNKALALLHAKSFYLIFHSWARQWFMNDDFMLSCGLVTLADWSNVYKGLFVLDPPSETPNYIHTDVDINVFNIDLRLVPKGYKHLLWTIPSRGNTTYRDVELDSLLEFKAQWFPLQEGSNNFKSRCLKIFEKKLDEYIRKQTVLYARKYKLNKGRAFEKQHIEWLIKWNYDRWTKAQISSFYNTTKENIDKNFKKLRLLGFPVRDGREE